MNITLIFFLMTKQQKSINDSLQNFCILSEQVPLLDHVKEILLPELLEVKPPKYYSSEMAKEKQWEQLFMPSTSTGIVYFKAYLSKGIFLWDILYLIKVS